MHPTIILLFLGRLKSIQIDSSFFLLYKLSGQGEFYKNVFLLMYNKALPKMSNELLYIPVVYNLYNFCIQNEYKISVWVEQKLSSFSG